MPSTRANRSPHCAQLCQRGRQGQRGRAVHEEERERPQEYQRAGVGGGMGSGLAGKLLGRDPVEEGELQVSRLAGATLSTDPQSAIVSHGKPGGIGSLPACSFLGVPFSYRFVTVLKNCSAASGTAGAKLGACSDPPRLRGARVRVVVFAALMLEYWG